MSELGLDTVKARADADHGLHCVTRWSSESAPRRFLDVCDDNPVHIACSIHCPTDKGACGGHPVCDPCYRLGLDTGLIRHALDGDKR